MNIRKILHQAGFRGNSLDIAYGIVMAESGGNARALANDSDDLSYGLFQINMIGGMGPDRRAQYGLDSNSDLWDPLTNAKVAFKLSQGGTNFSPWTTYTSGAYKSNMGGDAQVANGDGGRGGGGKDPGNYGYVQEFLDTHKGIADLVQQAQNQGWSDAKLAGEVKDTKWWSAHTEAQRQWSLVIAESPAQAKSLIKDARHKLEQVFGRSGVAVGDRELDQLAEKAARNGWDQAEMALIAGRHFDLKGDRPVVGDAGTAQDNIDKMVDAYGIPVSRKVRERWIKQSIAGNLDVVTMQDRLREQAKRLYSGIADQLDGDTTVRDLLDPYLSIAADQLGVPPEQMQTHDAKWTAALGGKDGPMTADQWTKIIRTDKRYGWDKGSVARGEAAALTGELAKMFGVGF